jgi:hypothetical protein
MLAQIGAVLLPIGEVEKSLKTSRWFAPEGVQELNDITHLRPTRNLVAHFVVRRFPNEDAFVFITKSDYDFKRVFGREPAPGNIMAGHVDGPDLQKAVWDTERVADWLSAAATEIEPLLMRNGPAAV